MRGFAANSASAVLALAATAASGDTRFGELPPDWISLSETHGVEAEICRDHLIDPDSVKSALPTGYRLIRAEEAAARQPAVAALLRLQPRLAAHALGSLCFLSARGFSVDGRSMTEAGSMTAAFWWARAEGPRHAHMRGRAGWVQLGSWYPASASNRQAIVTTDPMAEFVDLGVTAVTPDRWRVQLVLPGETVSAEVDVAGERVPSRAPQPGHMTVSMSGRAADLFTVYTYSGHHHRSASGRWQASGSGVFGRAFGIEGEAEAFGTLYQDGWVSRAGLYRSAPAR